MVCVCVDFLCRFSLVTAIFCFALNEKDVYVCMRMYVCVYIIYMCVCIYVLIYKMSINEAGREVSLYTISSNLTPLAQF